MAFNHYWEIREFVKPSCINLIRIGIANFSSFYPVCAMSAADISKTSAVYSGALQASTNAAASFTMTFLVFTAVRT